jgi:hypothetical protein
MLQQKVLDWFAGNFRKLPEQKFQEMLAVLKESPEKLVKSFEDDILQQIDLAVRSVDDAHINYERGPQGTSWQIVEHLKKEFVIEITQVPNSC